MRAFSIPPDGVRPKGSDADHGDHFLDPGEVSEGGFCLARIGANEKAFYSAPLSSGSNGARADPPMPSTREAFGGPSESRQERCVEPSAAPIASTPSARPPHPSCCHSETELNGGDVLSYGGQSSGYDVGGAATSPEPLLMEPEVIGEGVAEQAEDDEIGAADWLDVTHALLDSARGPG